MSATDSVKDSVTNSVVPPVGEIFGPELWLDSPDAVNAGWTDNLDGTYTCDGSQGAASTIVQFAGNVVGITFRVVFTIDSITAGSVRIRAGSGGFGSFRSTVDTFTQDIVGAGNTSQLIDADANFAGTVSSVSFREIL